MSEERNFDDPQPLNFDADEKKGPSDHLKEAFMTPEEERGDNETETETETGTGAAAAVAVVVVVVVVVVLVGGE